MGYQVYELQILVSVKKIIVVIEDGVHALILVQLYARNINLIAHGVFKLTLMKSIQIICLYF